MRGRRSTLATILGAITLLCPPLPLLAQQDSVGLPPIGTRVRLTLENSLDGFEGDIEPIPRMREGTLVGTLIAIDSGSIFVLRTRRTDLRLPARRVRRFEVGSPGWCHGRAHRRWCAALGTAAGVGLGLIAEDLWPGLGSGCPFNGGAACRARFEYRRQNRYMAFGAAAGLGVGLYVGRDRWTRITPWPPAQ